MENSLNSTYIKNLPYWKNQSIPQKGQKFTDPLFPPNENSLLSKDENGEFIDKKNGPKREKRMKSEEITWMRASEIYKSQKYLLFENKIDIVDISQGILGDCYFLASISSLTLFPNLIYQIFKTKDINEEGYFELILFIDGKFQIVIVDDYIPVFKKNNKICYSRPNNNEIWVCILEKAWAKINGGYLNIIKGWMHHALQAFTGFQSDSFTHANIKKEKLWEKIIEAKNNNFIITCSTNKNVESFGLVNAHAYSFINCLEIISKGKKIKLVQIRNIWGFKEWNGDWSDGSPLWGEEEKKQVNFCKKNNGLFYMSFEDYYSNFALTEICYLLFDSYSKSYFINEKNINDGNIFNIYLEEDGYFSVSIIRKMWRFNRELFYTIIPSFLSIVSYDPLNENVSRYFYDYKAKNDSYEDIAIIKYLKKGYYLIYAYHDIPHSTLKNEDYYIVKFDSTIKFKHKLMPYDYRENGFILLKNIIIQILLDKKEDLDSKQKYVAIGNQIGKEGIGYKIMKNDKNKWIKYIEDISELKNMFILTPYLFKENNEKEFEWFIPPKGFNIILGKQIDTKLPYNFTLKSKAFILENKPKNINENILNINIKDFANDSVSKEKQNEFNYDYISISLNDAEEVLTFNSIDIIKDKKKNLESKYPKIMELLNNLPKTKNDSELNWSKINGQNIEYIGQLNKLKKREGRGCYIYKNSDHILIGNFENGKINGKTIIYNKNLDKKIFEGNYISGKKNGKGILYLFNGDRYEGDFKNDKRTGKGIYYFKSEQGEQKWEGNFINGFMEGKGIFTNYDGKKKEITYHKGKQVK